MQVSRPSLIFIGTFTVIFFVLGLAFLSELFLDVANWTETAQHLYEGTTNIREESTYGYPGTPPLLLSVVFQHLFGFSAFASFALSLALLNAVSVAGVATTLYLLFPKNWWWLPASVISAFHTSVFSSTPPSLTIAPLTVLLFYLALLICIRKPSSTWPYIFFGINLGLSFAHRLETSVLITSVLGLYFLYEKISWRHLRRMLVYAFITCLVSDPYFLFMPIEHLGDMFYKMFFHYAVIDTRIGVRLSAWQHVPLALASFAITTLLTFFHKQHKILPLSFFLSVLGFTISLVGVIAFSHYRPLWYFLPAILLLETLLPLYLLHLTQDVQFSFLPSKDQAIARALFTGLIIFIFVGGYAALCIGLFHLPVGIFAIPVLHS